MSVWRKAPLRDIKQRTPRALEFNTDGKIRRICKRCGKGFTPTKEDQEYGEHCMKIMAGQTVLQDRYVVPPRKKRIKKPQNLSPEEDAVRAYRGAVIV